MTVRYQTVMVSIVLAGFITVGQAQTLSIPVGQQAPELHGQAVPARGMNGENVEARFGAPLLKSRPIGQPPISFWEYSDYYVYFEHNRVLHTVLKQR